MFQAWQSSVILRYIYVAHEPTRTSVLVIGQLHTKSHLTTLPRTLHKSLHHTHRAIGLCPYTNKSPFPARVNPGLLSRWF